MKTKLLLFVLYLFLPASVCFSQSPVQPTLPRARVIVFVHGLHGSRDSFRAANGAFWPDMIRTDAHFAYSDVDVAEYPTPASNGKMSSVQLADLLWTNLHKDHVWEHREVVFLAHSLGGILVEPTADLIRLQDELFEAIGKFIAPASSGSAAAFKTTPQDPEINQATIEAVATYFSQHRGEESTTVHTSPSVSARLTI